MVVPLYDDNSDRKTFPYLTIVLIVINILVFVLFQRLGDASGAHFTMAWVLVPEEIVTGQDHVTESRQMRNPRTGDIIHAPGLQETPISVYLTLLTSIFMHGGIAHIVGNMMFLGIFGDNVEDFIGHVRYIFFYLVCGFAASAAHVATTYALRSDPLVPCLGASGAISGVLGGYLLLFPHRRVTVLMFRVLTQVPAFIAIGLWFLFQVISGLGMLGGQEGGVAYGAHIGGFIAGVVLVRLFAIGKMPTKPPKIRYNFNDY